MAVSSYRLRDLQSITMTLRSGEVINLTLPPERKLSKAVYEFTVERPEVAREGASIEELIRASARGYWEPEYGEPIFTLKMIVEGHVSDGAILTVEKP